MCICKNIYFCPAVAAWKSKRMEKLEINILGCGSALPTTRHYPSSQVVNVRDKLFMIDCGEGTQLQFRHMKLKFTRLNHIFLSHLHGDHCFGLPGLVSTLGMLGRTGELVIHAHPDAEKIFGPVMDYFCRDLPYPLRFNAISPQEHALIYEDRSVRVYSLPLRHRVPTCGFLFEEKEKSRHLISDKIDFYGIPLRERQAIKEGADFITPEGTVIENKYLTRPPVRSRKYAYCSDTLPLEKIVPLIEGADLLYHEATFDEQLKARARETYHSTAAGAARIARLANVKQLLIGHFSARYLDEEVLLSEARNIFPETILAREGLVVPVEG